MDVLSSSVSISLPPPHLQWVWQRPWLVQTLLSQLMTSLALILSKQTALTPVGLGCLETQYFASSGTNQTWSTSHYSCESIHNKRSAEVNSISKLFSWLSESLCRVERTEAALRALSPPMRMISAMSSYVDIWDKLNLTVVDVHTLVANNIPPPPDQ